jgi:hypothetical protein
MALLKLWLRLWILGSAACAAIIVIGCGGGSGGSGSGGSGAGGSSSGTSSGTSTATQPSGQNQVPWAFRFAASSQNSQKPLTVDANLVVSSTDINSTTIEIQGGCTTPSSASESVTGAISGNAVSITVAYGGETVLLTGTLATDRSSMGGSYSATGTCGPDSGRWAAFKIAAANGSGNGNGPSYVGVLQPGDSYVPIGGIVASLTTDASLNVSGIFNSSVPCFNNLTVTGTQIGARIQGTGTDASGTPLQFAFVADDATFHSMTGSITVNGTCPFVNGIIFNLTPPNVSVGAGITVPDLPPVLSEVSPSKVANLPLSGITVFGSNFTSKSQVFIDGNAAITSFLNTGVLSAGTTQIFAVGTHSVSVTTDGGTSATLPLVVYTALQGPQPFLPPSSPTPSGVGRMSIADVNGDGIPDLFVAGTVFLGQGDGTFKFGGNAPPNAFMIAELNGDGLAELIGYNGNQLLIWPGTGDPTFSVSPLTFPSFPLVSTPVIAQVADIDGDGHLDLIVRGTIYFGRGNLQFDVVQSNFGDPLAVGDFNDDGKLDILTDGQTVLNTGNRTFTLISSGLNSSSAATVADFNGDGILDIASTFLNTSSGGELLVNYGRGDGTFYLQGLIGTPDRIESIAVADLNHDGRPDIVTSFITTAQVGAFTNDGQGAFQVAYASAPSGSNGNQLLEADLNRDGKPDLVILNGSGNVYVMLGK